MPLHPAPRAIRTLALLLAPVLVVGSVLVASPAQAQKIRPDFWGMHDNDWTSAPGAAVGSANLTTSGVYWHQIETADGVYDWARLRAQIEAAKAARAKPMLVLGGTPAFHSTARLVRYRDRTSMPKRWAWRRYVHKVVAQYGSSIDYQIWPEPNIRQNWTGTPQQMAQLTIDAARIINRRTRGRATVVSPAVALRLRSQRRWMTRYFEALGPRGARGYLDVVAVDPFPHKHQGPEHAYRLMQQARTQLHRMGVRKPIWNNEINYHVVGANQSTRPLPAWKQAPFVARTYLLSAAAGMQRVYWLGWFRSHELGVHMLEVDGSTTAAGDAYTVVRAWLNGAWFSGCAQTRRGPTRGVYTCTARKGREVRRIYWKPTGRKARVRTVRSTRKWQTIDSRVTRRRGSRIIRVGSSPIMVASRH